MAMPIFNYSKVKPLRQAKGLKQAEVAMELGISRPTYLLVEQGDKEPTITQLYTLARLLGVDAGELCSNLPALSLQKTDYAKFKELIAACAIQGADGGSITKTKLAILAYLADFTWYRLHAQPLSGMVYRRVTRGPVGDEFFRALDELYEEQSIAIEPHGAAMLIRTVEQHPTKLLSKAELDLIHNVCTKWRQESTEAIVFFALSQGLCKAAKPGDPIPYEAVLNQPEDVLY
ncbi:MAG TPA: helix-turn-helix domain-containing protein [Candidatus Saccharimonadales bacterium]